MNRAGFVVASLTVFATSCQRSAPPVPVEEPRPGITVNGDGLSAEDKKRLTKFGEALLADALHRAINSATIEMAQKLKIADDVERELLDAAFRWIDEDRSDGNPAVMLSLFLARPGDAGQRPETIELTVKEHVIRVTRSSAKIDRPTAHVTLSAVSQGRITQRELLLVYSDGQWQPQRPSVERQSIR